MKQVPRYTEAELLDKIAQNNAIRANILSVKLEKIKMRYLDLLNTLDQDGINEYNEKHKVDLLNPTFEVDVPKWLRQERIVLKQQARDKLWEDYLEYFNITEDWEPDNIFKWKVEFIMNWNSEKEAIINI